MKYQKIKPIKKMNQEMMINKKINIHNQLLGIHQLLVDNKVKLFFLAIKIIILDK